MASRCPSLLVLLALTFLAPSAAQAEDKGPQKVRLQTIEGSLHLRGAIMEMQWSAWVPVEVKEVRQRLMAWKATIGLVKNAIDPELQASTPTTARMFFERKSPVFFMPNPDIVVDASMTELKNGTASLTWTLVKGLPKSLHREWVLREEAGGTRIEARSKVEFPFSPPSFVMNEDPKEFLTGEAERFRKVVGAKEVLARAPAQR